MFAASHRRAIFSLAGATAIAAAALTPITAVHAEDGKVYSSSLCAPYAGGPSLAHFDANSFNVTAGPQWVTVICGAIKDEVNVTNGLNSALLAYYKPVAGTLYVNVNSTSRDYRFSAISSRSDGSTVAGYKSLTLPAVAAFAGGYYSLKISLPYNAGILSYQLNEYQP